jgi:FkbM family methyltransferase
VEPIRTLFDLSPIVGEPAAVINGGNGLPVTFRTAAERWAYAVRLQRVEPRTDPSTAVVIRVDLVVHSGTVGVGCLNIAETAFVEEIVVNPAPVATTVEIVVANPADAGPLIVRNVSADGASEATLLRAECFAIDAPDTVRGPGLSDPHPRAQWNRYYGTNGDTLVERLRVQAYNALTEPRVTRWVDGLSVRVLPNDQLSRALYVSGTYEPNTLSVLRRVLSQGDTFIDVGANVGIISLVASKWVGATGHVYSFEPSAREYNNLLDHLERNGAVNVSPLQLAVASTSGRVDLRVAPASYAGLNTLGSAFPYQGVDVHRIEQVESVTLDEFVDARSITRVAAVKLDVEGAEGAALTGARRLLRDQRPVLVIEVFSRSLEANGATPATIERMLRDAGYRLFSIDDGTAQLNAIADLTRVDEQNIVAVPEERSESLSR